MAPSRAIKHALRLAAIALSAYVILGYFYYDDSTAGRKVPGRFDPEGKLQTDHFEDSDWKKRRSIKEAFKHAWRAYERDAFGYDEYHPLTHRGTNLSGPGIGYMIVDSLDTLILMRHAGDPEIDAMYQRAHDWVAHSLDFSEAGKVNTFETTIRVLGGLLSAHALARSAGSGSVYLQRAVDLADRLLGSFETPTGIPFTDTHLKEKKGYADMPNGGAASTAEATTLQLEFKYLTHLTGDPKYWEAAVKVNRAVHRVLTPDVPSLVPIFISPHTGQFVRADIRLGSRGDSYYEYLLKQYLQTNRTEGIYRQMYDSSMSDVHNLLMRRTPELQLLYTTEFLNVQLPDPGVKADSSKWRVEHKQDHLVCFLAGLLMLGATEARAPVPPKDIYFPKDIPTAVRDWRSGKDLIKTCMATHETETGLSPEIAMFYGNKAPNGQSRREWYIKGGKNSQLLDGRYILRPETIESLFVAFRLTGDPAYRQQGWQIFRAIEKHCKIPVQQGGGYAAVRNVDVAEGFKGWEDRMDTFFLAETLKYLFLLFSDSSFVPLQEYVFNTEAHPLPVFTPSQELIDLIKV